MSKLYEKNEVLFSIIWIVVYVVGTSAADSISLSLGIEKLITALLCAVLSVILFGWIKKNGLMAKYGLTKPCHSPKAFLYYIPLLVIVSCNLWFGVQMNLPARETMLYIISMIFVGFLEEMIFRGLLFKAMEKGGLKSAVIVSSVTFGIGHIVNLFNSNGAEIIPNLCQICYAVLFGFLFVIIFHRSRSLIPCIVTHSALNSLSVFSAKPDSSLLDIAVAILLCIIAAAYAFILSKTLKNH